MKKPELGIYLSLVGVAFLWGTSFAVSKVALQELSPLNLAGVRFIAAALLFAVLLGARNARLRLADIPQFLLLGFLVITSYFYIQYTGLQYTTSINAALLLATSPVWTTLAGTLLGQEKVNGKLMGGCLLAFAGVALVISRGNVLALFMPETMLGDLLMLLNAFVWAGFTLYGKKIMNRYSPLVAVAYVNIFGALLLLPLVLVPSRINPIPVLEQLGGVSWATGAAVGYLALLCSVYGYSTWYRGIEKIGAVRTASFQYLNPLFAFGAGFWLLQETVTAVVLVGGAAVIGGVYVTNTAKGTPPLRR